MKIGDVAEILNISVSSLRRWEDYLEVEIPRDEKGDRFYPKEWVEYLKQVKALVDKGLEFKEIKELINPPNTSPPEPPPSSDDIDGLKQEVSDLSNDLVSLRERINSIDSQVKGLSPKVENLSEQTQNIENDIKGLNDVVKGLPLELKGIKSSQNELEKVVSSLQADIKELKDKPQANPFWQYVAIGVLVLMALGVLSQFLQG